MVENRERRGGKGLSVVQALLKEIAQMLPKSHPCEGRDPSNFEGMLASPEIWMGSRLRALASRKSPDPRKMFKTIPSCHAEPKAKHLSFIDTVPGFPIRCVIDRSFAALRMT